MTQVKSGDKVKVHYTGKLENGEVFDSSRNREPLEVQIGSGNLIPGFENALIGMEEGQTKKVTILQDEAYGPHRQELIINVERNAFPDTLTPSVGQRLQVTQPNGVVIPVTVMETKDDTVTLDANHPLAGKDLDFEIELVSIE